MATSDRKTLERLAQALEEAWNNKDRDLFVSCFAENAIIHHPLLEAGGASPAQVFDIIAENLEIRSKLQKVLIDGDEMFLSFDEQGTQIGDLPGIPMAKGGTAWISACASTSKTRDGKIVTMQVYEDTASFAKQLS